VGRILKEVVAKYIGVSQEPSNAVGQLTGVLMRRPVSHEVHSRSLAKALTWRFTATIDAFVISYIVTSKVVIAGTTAATEIFTKILIYYFHERAWALIPWGRRRSCFPGPRMTAKSVHARNEARRIAANVARNAPPAVGHL
jgi:uncharacterized membrane protein